MFAYHGESDSIINLKFAEETYDLFKSYIYKNEKDSTKYTYMTEKSLGHEISDDAKFYLSNWLDI